MLQPERLEEILSSVLDRRQERTERCHEHIAELNKRAAEADVRLKRLYDAIESGVADLDDPALKERVAGLKAIRDQAHAEAEHGRAMLASAGNRRSPRPWCRPSPLPPASGCGPAAATAGITFARSPNASRSRMARSGSWDQERSAADTQAVSGVKSARPGFAVLFRNGVP